MKVWESPFIPSHLTFEKFEFTHFQSTNQTINQIYLFNIRFQNLEFWDVTNQQRNLDVHIGSHIFYEDLYRSNCITIYGVPFVIDMLLARDLIVGISIPSSISLPASLFTCSVMQHPVTNSLVTLLARLIVMCITERAQRYLSDNRSDKS